METVGGITNNVTEANGTTADETATDANNLTTDESKLEVPSWINSNYFKEILALDGNSKWKYISHDVRMANEKGENYASVLYRVKVIAANEGNLLAKILSFKKFAVPEICHTVLSDIVTDKINCC